MNPSTPALTDALEHNGILYVAGYFSETVDRFDIASSVWLTPINLGDAVTSLAVTGDTIIAGTLRTVCFSLKTDPFAPTSQAGKFRFQLKNTSLISRPLEIVQPLQAAKFSSYKNTQHIVQMLTRQQWAPQRC